MRLEPGAAEIDTVALHRHALFLEEGPLASALCEAAIGADDAMPREFVVPGETPTSAALELARTILRRAERRAVGLRRAGLVPGEHLVPYLNRLADLVWVLARAAEQAEARTATPARRTKP